MRIDSISGSIDSDFNPFSKQFIEEIIGAIVTAWSRMRNPNTDELEDQITFRLAGRLQHDNDFRELPFEVVPQYWLLDLQGHRLGRLDLRFKHLQSRRDYLAFEAKRLHVAYPSGFKTEYSVYLGDEGIMCFLTGKYSSGLPFAGMMAYVMDNDTENAWQGLCDAIDSRESLLMLKPRVAEEPLRYSTSLDPLRASALIAETHHESVEISMRITHVILPRET